MPLFSSRKNHGSEWTAPMDADLTRLFCQGKGIKDLAEKHFFRTENAIKCRLRYLLLWDGEEVDEDMSKAPNRYLVLGVRKGHVKRLAARRGYNPDEAVKSALLTDEVSSSGVNDCLILVEIKDASDDVGAPLNTEVKIIEREAPVPPYRLVSLNRQGC